MPSHGTLSIPCPMVFALPPGDDEAPGQAKVAHAGAKTRRVVRAHTRSMLDLNGDHPLAVLNEQVYFRAGMRAEEGKTRLGKLVASARDQLPDDK